MEDEEKEIAPVWASVPARGASAISEERHGLCHFAEAREFHAFEQRLGLDLNVIVKERQQQKFGLEREMKVAEAAPVLKKVWPAVRETFEVVLVD